MFSKRKPTPISCEAILERIAEIDHKFKQTESWLHSMLANDARERELLVAEPNGRFNAGLNARSKARLRCLDQLPVFELALKKNGRTSWRWCVCTTAGNVVMQGLECSRRAAKYKAHRALFLLLLSAPYRSIQPSTTQRPEYGRRLAR
jgi:hypothetical protein